MYSTNERAYLRMGIKTLEECVKRTQKLEEMLSKYLEAYIEATESEYFLTQLQGEYARRHLRAIETELWYQCNGLVKLHELTQGLNRTAEDIPIAGRVGETERIVTIAADEDHMIVYVPSLHKGNHYHPGYRMAQPYEGLMMAAVSEHKPVFSAEQINIYILGVYGIGTPDELVLDPDNLEPKRIIDIITGELGIEDVGLNVHLHTMATKTDEIASGFYVLVEPLEAQPKSAIMIKDIIKRARDAQDGGNYGTEKSRRIY